MDKSSIEIASLLLLSTAGWLIAFYYFRVHKGLNDASVWWMPRFLQMINCRCDEIADTIFGQTFGKSNSIWGMWYFSILILMVLGYWQFNLPSISSIFILGLLAFAHSVYLTWGLFVLRVACRPCIGTHAINCVIFAVLLSHTYPLFFID